MININIPFRVPTINNLYFHKGNVKIIKPEARKLRDEIIGLCEGINTDTIIGQKLKVEVCIAEDWFNKKGEVRKLDIMNREKFLTDSVFKALDIDDKWIFEYNIKKLQSNVNMADMTISAIGAIK